MLLSIITPTYNRSDDLKLNYKIIKKNYKNNNLEWILISETSDHKTQRVISKFDKKIVKNFSGNWKGKNDKAFNFGLKQSKGYLINIHGDDDFFSKNFMHHLQKVFKPHISWYIGYGEYLNDDYGKSRWIITFIKKQLLNLENFKLMNCVNFIMTPSIFFRRSLVGRSGLRTTKQFSDYYLWMDILSMHKPFVIKKNLSFAKYSSNTKTGTFDLDRYFMISKYIRKKKINFFYYCMHILSIFFIISFHFFNKFIPSKIYQILNNK